jgi:predicted dehydrogenase
MSFEQKLNRRELLAPAAAFTLLPRHVLGGPGYVAPSDKITMAYVGCGFQGLSEMLRMVTMPEVQIVAVCDPVKYNNQYIEWSKDSMRSSIARALGKPDWGRAAGGCPGGRDVAKEIVESIYTRDRGAESYKGCNSYEDFRELLEKEKDITAVKVMTPDHLHATVALSALNLGKNVLMHKPIANRLAEARMVVDTARRKKVNTHFLAANSATQIKTVKGWIDDGVIGKLREIHNWSNRPVWPQYAVIPADRPLVPPGFNWDLWLGPSLDRPYHPHYTFAVFRGWYEFGGGSVADMGHYSQWAIYKEFDLDAPVMVESRPSTAAQIVETVSRPIRNDYSFPSACTIRWRFAAKGNRGPLEIYWYDGGIKPPTPEELEADSQEFEREGMMFVGEKGKILAGFRGENPRLLPEAKMREFRTARNLSEPAPRQRGAGGGMQAEVDWVAAFQGGAPTYGDFTCGQAISDAMNLAAISLRMGGRRLLWDAAAMKITNVPEANNHLVRDYRKGWELTA